MPRKSEQAAAQLKTGNHRKIEPNTVVYDQAMLDQATARQLAIIHINDIYNGSSASIGEQELLMMFLHLLHARRRSLDPVDVVARRADFDEQMRLVFEGESA